MKACGDGSNSSETGPPSRVSQAQIATKQRQEPIPIAMLTEGVGSRRQNDTARVRATAFPALSVNTVTVLGQELALKNQNRISPTPHAVSHASKRDSADSSRQADWACYTGSFGALVSDFRLIHLVPRCDGAMPFWRVI